MIIVNDILYSYDQRITENDFHIKILKTDIEFYLSKKLKRNYLNEYHKILNLDKEYVLVKDFNISFINTLYNNEMNKLYQNILMMNNKRQIINYILNFKKKILNTNDEKYFLFKYNLEYWFTVKNQTIYKIAPVFKTLGNIKTLDKYLILNNIYFKWVQGFF